MKKNEIDAAMAYNDYATNNNTGHYLNNIQQELMKAVIVIGFILLGAVGWSQTVPYEMGATKHDSLSIGGKWLTSVSHDSTLAGIDSNAVATEYAVKKYVDNNVNTLSGVAAVSDSVKALYDTAAVHLDTMQLHDVRIKALHAWVLDSVARLTDTTQLHDTRLKNLSAEIDAVGTGVVDDTIKFSNGSYVTIPVSGNSIILGTANEHSLIGE